MVMISAKGHKGNPLALDMTVSSGMRADIRQSTAQSPEGVFARCEERKNTFQQTLQQCTEQGSDFMPVVFKAHTGAWSGRARIFFDFLARSQLMKHRFVRECPWLRMPQRISITLHRENTRAILRRTSDQRVGQSSRPCADIHNEEAFCSYISYYCKS